MKNDQGSRSATPPDEPAIDPATADRAVTADTFDTTGYGEAYAAVETEATADEVEEAWEAAESDMDQADLRLMDPAERLEPGRDPQEGE